MGCCVVVEPQDVHESLDLRLPIRAHVQESMQVVQPWEFFQCLRQLDQDSSFAALQIDPRLSPPLSILLHVTLSDKVTSSFTTSPTEFALNSWPETRDMIFVSSSTDASPHLRSLRSSNLIFPGLIACASTESLKKLSRDASQQCAH